MRDSSLKASGKFANKMPPLLEASGVKLGHETPTEEPGTSKESGSYFTLCCLPGISRR